MCAIRVRPTSNTALAAWLDGYHQRQHSSTGTCPFQRLVARMQCLRAAPADLKDHFRIVVRRRVAKDRSVTIDGKLFEAPVSLIGKRIDLYYHKSDMHRVEAHVNAQSFGELRPVDLCVTCRVKRDRNRCA